MFFSRQQTAIDAKRTAVASAVHLLNEQARVYQDLLVVIEEQLQQINLSLYLNRVARSQAEVLNHPEERQEQLRNECDQLINKKVLFSSSIRHVLVVCSRQLLRNKNELCSAENASAILYLFFQSLCEYKILNDEEIVLIKSLLDLGSSETALDEFRLAQTEARNITNQAMNLSFVLIMLRFLLVAALGMALSILIIEVLAMFHLMPPLVVIAVASTLIQLYVVSENVAACTKLYDDARNALNQPIDMNGFDFAELDACLIQLGTYIENSESRLGYSFTDTLEPISAASSLT